MNPTLLMMFAAVAFMIYWSQRTQKKQYQKRMDSLNRLEKGIDVITIGGLYGTIDEVDTEKGIVVLDVDGVYLTFELAAIKKVLPATEEVVETVVTNDAVEVIETEESSDTSAIEE